MPSPAATLASRYAIEGMAWKRPGAQSSRLRSGWVTAAALTMIVLWLDSC